jgi:hypothetical protein
MFRSYLPLVVCRRARLFLIHYLCLLAHSGVQHILCCVFVLFVFVLCLVYPMLPVSQDCPFLIAPSVFSNVYFFKWLTSEQELLTLPEHMHSPWCWVGFAMLDFKLSVHRFVENCLSLCPFSFDHCNVCLSFFHWRVRLPLWYLQAFCFLSFFLEKTMYRCTIII